MVLAWGDVRGRDHLITIAISGNPTASSGDSLPRAMAAGRFPGRRGTSKTPSIRLRGHDVRDVASRVDLATGPGPRAREAFGSRRRPPRRRESRGEHPARRATGAQLGRKQGQTPRARQPRRRTIARRATGHAGRRRETPPVGLGAGAPVRRPTMLLEKNRRLRTARALKHARSLRLHPRTQHQASSRIFTNLWRMSIGRVTDTPCDRRQSPRRHGLAEARFFRARRQERRGDVLRARQRRRRSPRAAAARAGRLLTPRAEGHGGTWWSPFETLMPATCVGLTGTRGHRGRHRCCDLGGRDAVHELLAPPRPPPRNSDTSDCVTPNALAALVAFPGSPCANPERCPESPLFCSSQARWSRSHDEQGRPHITIAMRRKG